MRPFKNHFTLVNYFRLTKISGNRCLWGHWASNNYSNCLNLYWLGMREKKKRDVGQSKYLKPQAWKNKWKTKRNREREREWAGRTNVYLSCSGGFSIIFLKWTEQAKELLFRQRAEAEMTYNEWTHQNGIPQPYFSVHTKKGLRRKLLKNIRLEGIVVHDPRKKRVQKEHKTHSIPKQSGSHTSSQLSVYLILTTF